MTTQPTIAVVKEEHLYSIWKNGYSQIQPEWKKWDGPYFEDYQMYPDFEAFRMSKLYNFFCNDTVWGIFVDREPIGIVTRHWEDKKLDGSKSGLLSISKSIGMGATGQELSNSGWIIFFKLILN
jgi:hypothetical protein